jgi:hypothetical protein
VNGALDSVVTIATTAFAVTAVGIALRPNAPTASVIKAFFSGLAASQKATFGPS